MRIRYIGPLIPILLLVQIGRTDCRDTSAYFANGMFNEPADASRSLDVLQTAIANRYPKQAQRIHQWKIAYNTNERLLARLWRVFDQKRSEIKGNFWSSFFGLLNRSEWARQQTSLILKDISQDQIVKDADLKKQILDYVDDLNHGYSVVTVAHSQGNFYSLFAFERLSDWSDQLSLISVATPAGRARSDKYVTLHSDRVIALIPDALPSNAKKTNPGLFDHKFIEDYLRSPEPRSYILSEFERALGDRARHSILTQGVFDESLEPVLDWFRDYFRKPTPLEPYQCMLFYNLVALYRPEDSENFGCKDRNLAAVEKSLDDCIKDFRRHGEEPGTTTCPFAGLATPSNFAWGLWETGESFRFKEINPKCDWHGMFELEEKLGVEGIKQSKAFLSRLMGQKR